MREAVAMQRELHDGPHPDLAEALNNLGWVIGETGQYRGSRAAVPRGARDEARACWASAHPEIAIGLNNVAFVLYEQGKYDAAEVLYLDALDDAAQAPRRRPSGRRAWRSTISRSSLTTRAT